MNSRDKGARGERDAAKALNTVFPGLNCIRGQQRSGVEQADVVNLHDDLHIEVKRYKSFSIWKFIQQMRRDRKDGQVPVLMFRPDRDPDWHVAVSLGDLKRFASIIAGLAAGDVSGKTPSRPGHGTEQPSAVDGGSHHADPTSPPHDSGEKDV